MNKLLSIAILAAVASAASAQDTEAPFVVKESGQRFGTLQDAVNAVGGGEGTILIAPGHYRQCAVQQAGRIAFVASQPGTAVLDGIACEGKAALVLGGRSASIDGLVIEHIAVGDGNGAGIRLEQG